jgi:hypothetical protein
MYFEGVIEHIHGKDVLIHPADGTPVRDERDALDLIGNAGYLGASWVAIPADRIADDFFQLRNGIAGEILQKFVNYGLGLAIFGDISAHTETSSALADLVRESNRGRQAWFLAGLDELRTRLATLRP